MLVPFPPFLQSPESSIQKRTLMMKLNLIITSFTYLQQHSMDILTEQSRGLDAFLVINMV